MSPHVCARHPAAADVEGHCAACLVEAALGTGAEERAVSGTFTIQVPLGGAEPASVFLVRGGSPWHRLLRLKQWRTQAPPGFVDAFDRLKWQLTTWRQPAIVMPVAAWVDAAGFPSVLTEFRQGVPLLDAVNSGRMNRDAAAAALGRLRDVIGAAHARGLAHGSIVPGNVLVGPPDSGPYLLDFGCAVLLGGDPAGEARVESDLRGFARLEAALHAFTAKSERL